MGYTPKYNLYVTDDENEKFVDWRARINATTNSNMTKIEGALSNQENEIESIGEVIPASATPANKLVSASEMGDAIEAVEAKQLYATNAQGSFETKAALISAGTFYDASGTVAAPTKNDVAYVLADESHDGKPAKYVVSNDTTGGDDPVWGFVITFSDNAFTLAQMDAINSGINGTKRAVYDQHIANTSNPHDVTKGQIGLGNVDNKSEETIKGDFTGSIAADNAGFVTGGDVHAALEGRVPTSRTINGKPLDSNVSLAVDDISGAGDMAANDYDPNGAVATAGGIPEYVAAAIDTAITRAIGGGY